MIEKASHEVLKSKNTPDFIETFKRARKLFKGKLYIMTYANVPFGYGLEKFAASVEKADGIIIADLPLVESRRFEEVFTRYNLNLIHFVTPESSFKEIDAVKRRSKEFIYFVSVRGTTGGKFMIDEETKRKVRYARMGFHVPVILGFGIRTREDIERACEISDGVVIGSEAIRAINRGSFKEYIESIM